MRKCNNTGFCRVEWNGEKCVASICLKDGCGVEGTAHVYVLEEMTNNDCSEKTYSKTKIDKCCEACAGILNIKLSVDNGDGIYVECGGRIYVALWRDNCKYIRIVQPRKIKIEKDMPKKENVRKEISQQQKVNDSSDFARIYNRLCKIRIVLEGVEYPAVKLKPHELMFLPRSCWRMANNIFLMESYYRYGHILFMNYDDRYVLAVPWKKDKRMEEQAKRFGFTKSLIGYEYGKSRDEKQYWLKYL